MIVIGAGWHGREVARSCMDSKYFVDGFLDDNVKGLVGGIPIVGTLSDIPQFMTLNASFALGLGNNKLRAELGQALIEGGAHLPVIIHPTAVVWSNDIGAGSVIFPFAIVSVAAKIGRFCIVNKHATVGHGAEMGDGCNVADAAVFSGKMGKQAFMGLHSVAIPGVDIGPNATLGAGAVAVTRVIDGLTVRGVPAR